MNNIWTRINDDVAMYMKSICEKYKLVCIKISPLKTALVGEGFALIITIDRFDATVSYLHNDSELQVYLCDNYFAEKYDANDRINLLNGEGADIIVRNNIIVISNGLTSKWENVLRGETGWIENYKKSKWFSTEKLSPKEIQEIEHYMKERKK